MNPSPAGSRLEPGDRTLRFRALLAGSCVLAAFTLLSWRLIHVQVHRHAYYSAMVEHGHRDTVRLEAHRGTIFDTHGHVLAGDEPVQHIAFDRTFLQYTDHVARALAKVEDLSPAGIKTMWTLEEMQQRYLAHVTPLIARWTGQPPSVISAAMRDEKKVEVMLAREIRVNDGLQLRAALEKDGFGEYKERLNKVGAVIFKDGFARRYPSAVPVFHIVGKYGELKEQPGILQGTCGLEKSCHQRLAGRPGSREIEIDGLGNEVPGFRGTVRAPVPGENLRTTLDPGLHALVAEELDEPSPPGGGLSVAQMNANRVIVVLFEPKTMALRAVVSRDYTRKQEGLQLTNDAVEYVYDPGSTMKIATVAAALSAGRVSPATNLEISASGRYDDGDVPPITDDHPYATLTVEGILIKSSNIGAYKLARQTGLAKFREYLTDGFGFGRPPGLGLPLEQSGLFPPRWTMVELSRAAFGYAFSTTPAHMLTLLGTILNDGMHRPLRVIESWTDDKGAPLSLPDETPPRRVITSRAAQQMKQMLIQVVEKGTGKLARSEEYEIGGKTGTSNKVTRNKKIAGRGSYDSTRQVVSFLGFISSGSGPELAGICIIDEPKLSEKMNYGGKLAAPLFKRIVERAMAYYEVPAQFAVNPNQE